MRVLMFKERFAPIVKSGSKRQTIRCAARCKVGDTLSLRCWTGLPYRSKQEILREETCSDVVPVVISRAGIQFNFPSCGLADAQPSDAMANADGFVDWEDMVTWFEKTHKLPFHGDLIRWEIKKGTTI